MAAYLDYRDLLADGADVAVVALPHHLHCEVAVAALQAGCHVLVEKPLAVSVEQCRAMLQAARRNGRILAVTDTAAYHPGALLTGARFRDGTLGRFLSGVHHNARFYFHQGRPAWFLDPATSGGGMFANVGLHRLAQTRACLPGLEPVTVSASVSRWPSTRWRRAPRRWCATGRAAPCTTRSSATCRARRGGTWTPTTCSRKGW